MGPFEHTDEKMIRETFRRGDLRDGFMLYVWANSFGQTTDLASQLVLMKTLGEWPMLPVKADRGQIARHMFGLLEAWLAVAPNSEKDPAER